MDVNCAATQSLRCAVESMISLRGSRANLLTFIQAVSLLTFDIIKPDVSDVFREIMTFSILMIPHQWLELCLTVSHSICFSTRCSGVPSYGAELATDNAADAASCDSRLRRISLLQGYRPVLPGLVS